MTWFSRSPLRRALGVLLILIVCGYSALLFAMNRAMHRPPEQFGQFMSRMPMGVFLIAPFETMWNRARAGQLQVGDAAPEFEVDSLDHSAKLNLATLRKGGPIVLVFGSYT